MYIQMYVSSTWSSLTSAQQLCHAGGEGAAASSPIEVHVGQRGEPRIFSDAQIARDGSGIQAADTEASA